MRSLNRVLAAFLANESGATAVEYALICSGIMLAILTSINAMGTAITSVFNSAATALK
jgi:pilus assembly protein Flp/PilA